MAIQIEQFEVRIPLVHPFRTSFGVQKEKSAIIIKMTDDEGNVGWGESSLESVPGYCYETSGTAWLIQNEFLIPAFKGISEDTFPEIGDVHRVFAPIRGHEFAKTGLESAFWSLKASREGKSLGEMYGATKSKIPTGVSIGIQNRIEDLLQRISFFLDQGYKRIKIKIEPGWDYEVLKAVRKEYGDVPLMVDANSAYTLSDKDVEILKSLDRFDLMMIEQPLDYQDILMHKRLQAQISTPVCLDESIHTFNNALMAIEEDACRIINIKPGRVGGYYEAKRIAEALGKDKVWLGGMLETGIGRIHNLFIQAKEEFTIPGDTSGSDRYFKRDIITPHVLVDENGYIEVPRGEGLGFEVNEPLLKEYTVQHLSH